MSDPRAPAFVRAAASAGQDPVPGFVLRGSQTAGTLSVLEFGLAGWQSGPDLHRHAASDETFYVLDGSIEFQVGDGRHVLRRGDVAWVPRGTAHTFANAGAGPARALTLATPAGLEDFLAEQAAYLARCAATGRDPDSNELDRLRARHGGQRLGPPIRTTTAPPR